MFGGGINIHLNFQRFSRIFWRKRRIRRRRRW